MTQLGRLSAALCALALAACQPDEAPRSGAAGVVPERIVSLAPSITELLFALEAGDRVVGVTRFCDRPAAARERTPVGDSKQLSLETIVTLQPDLILINSETLAGALRPLEDRYRILLAPTETVAEVLDSIEIVGDAVGVGERARAMRGDLERQIATAREASTGEGRGKVMVVLQRDPFFVAGPGSYVDELLGILGWENAVAGLDARWPCISAEALLAFAPDVLLDMGFGESEAEGDPERGVREYWKRFATLPAVRAGRVHALRADEIVRPGPALREALEALGAALSDRANPR